MPLIFLVPHLIPPSSFPGLYPALSCSLLLSLCPPPEYPHSESSLYHQGGRGPLVLVQVLKEHRLTLFQLPVFTCPLRHVRSTSQIQKADTSPTDSWGPNQLVSAENLPIL